MNKMEAIKELEEKDLMTGERNIMFTEKIVVKARIERERNNR